MQSRPNYSLLLSWVALARCYHSDCQIRLPAYWAGLPTTVVARIGEKPNEKYETLAVQSSASIRAFESDAFMQYNK